MSAERIGTYLRAWLLSVTAVRHPRHATHSLARAATKARCAGRSATIHILTARGAGLAASPSRNLWRGTDAYAVPGFMYLGFGSEIRTREVPRSRLGTSLREIQCM